MGPCAAKTFGQTLIGLASAAPIRRLPDVDSVRNSIILNGLTFELASIRLLEAECDAFKSGVVS